MIQIGCAFYRHEHPHFVISDPAANGGKVLCVNLTTFDDECPDDECILDVDDFAWIKPAHPTVVAFSKAKIWDAVKIDACLKAGELHPVNPPVVPANTIAKVVAAAKFSRELSRDHKAML